MDAVVNQFPEFSSAADASDALQALIEMSSADGDLSAFDPWPLVQAELRLHEGPRVEVFEQWKALREAAWAAQQGYRGPLLRSPERKEDAARRCIEHRQRIEAGDGSAVLDAIAECVTHGVVVPAWLAAAFVSRHERVILGLSRSWADEEVFGNAHPKGTGLPSIRNAAIFGGWAYDRALWLLMLDPQRALDRAGLYEEVGERIGRSHSHAFELIRDHLQRAAGALPPLSYVREQLRSGTTIGDCMQQWKRERVEAFFRGAAPSPEM